MGRLWLVVTGLALLLPGCAEGRTGAEQPWSAEQALLALPAPHQPSALGDGYALDGADFLAQSANNRVAADGGQALYSPDWPGTSGNLEQVAYAIYGFDLTGFTGEPVLELVWAEPPAGADQYLAVYNAAESAWAWHGPAASTVTLPELTPYNLDGVLYVAAAVTGSDTARLHMVSLGVPDCPTNLPIDEITLPPGFSISVYSDDVPNARGLALSPAGVLYVGSRSAQKVYAVRDLNADGCADEVITVASGYDAAVGVDWHDGNLYFSNYDKIWRIDDIEANLYDLPQPGLVTDDLPTDTHHGWKFIRFGPDDKLYVPIGAPCNICDAGDPYAALHRMNADGSGTVLIARGIRNTVGFDWHPVTGELWFTDNGRDLLGDNLPPDELNRIPADFAGTPHFGYPHWHGEDIADPDFGDGHTAAEFVLPARELGPHVAALGMRFYTGAMFPAEYRNQIFIAEHGSWNRSDPLGARVMLVRVAEDKITTTSYEVFAEGWQRADGSRWGRPVDVLTMPDGSLLVSDDLAGAVYRITYSAP